MPEAELRRPDLAADPLEQFGRWFAEAEAAVDVPEAMALATAAPDGSPSMRMVLLKGFGERGLVFHWSPLGRQVRVEGGVERVPEEESDAYFATRPRDAQVGALASRQSDPLASRTVLYERLAELEADLAGERVPRPPTWGGYLVVPAAWEFWQHRESRLHDRFRYERDADGGWAVDRLFP